MVAKILPRDIWDEDFRQDVSRRLVEEFPEIEVGEDGYKILPEGTVDGYPAFQARVRQLFQQRIQPDGNLLPQMDVRRKKGRKEYLQPLFTAKDLVTYPELLALGLNRKILATASRYLGTLPVLRTVDVFWSPPRQRDTTQGSQNYHFDHDNYRELKMFFYIDDMDEEGGPFTFLPKTISDAVDKQAKPFKGSRYADEEIYRFCAPSDAISFTGPAGTAALVDTSNCLHYGGRVDQCGRLLVQHLYLRPTSNIIGHDRLNMASIAGLELDDLGRMVIAEPPWAAANRGSEAEYDVAAQY